MPLRIFICGYETPTCDLGSLAVLAYDEEEALKQVFAEIAGIDYDDKTAVEDWHERGGQMEEPYPLGDIKYEGARYRLQLKLVS